VATKFPGPSPKQKKRDVSMVKKWAGVKEPDAVAGASSDSPGDPSASGSQTSSSDSLSQSGSGAPGK